MRSTVCVDDGARFGSASPAGHLDRVDDDLRGDPIRDRPANYPARVRVDHGSAVDPPVPYPVLGDVEEPEPVPCIRRKAALYEVLVRRRVRLPASAFAAMRDTDEPVESHQPGDAFAADVDAEPESQLDQHAWRPIRLSQVGVDAADRGRQRRIGDRSRGRPPGHPVVVTGGRDLQEPTGHRDGDTVRGELLDQPEPYFGSTFFLAKYADARLRISLSISISSTRNRRRNSTSSLCSSVVRPGLRPLSIASATSSCEDRTR